MEMVKNPTKAITMASKVSSFDLFCFWFTTIDLLFLPYFTFISVSFSVPVIACWLLTRAKIRLADKEMVIVILVCILMIISTFHSVIYTGDVRFETTFTTSVKRLIQYIICFGYYFFYKDFFKRTNVNLNKVFFVFVVYVSLFAVFYLINPQLYASIKIIISPVDNHTRRYLASAVAYRFNYLWTDPNNIAYLMSGLLYWYLTREDNGIIRKFSVGVLSLLIVASTVSNGGIIMTALMAVFVMLKWIYGKLRGRMTKTRNIMFATLVMIIAIVVMKNTNIGSYLVNILMAKIQTRLQHYTSTDNLSGGRFEDLAIATNYLNPIFLFIGSGKEGFTSENGHLYWICMYGFPSYLGLIWLMFRKLRFQKWIEYIWILPFLVCFTMNIGIGEFKWMGILFMLLAYSRYEENGRVQNIYDSE